jgi:hypothetical protein
MQRRYINTSELCSPPRSDLLVTRTSPGQWAKELGSKQAWVVAELQALVAVAAPALASRVRQALASAVFPGLVERVYQRVPLVLAWPLLVGI